MYVNPMLMYEQGQLSGTLYSTNYWLLNHTSICLQLLLLSMLCN